MPKDPLCPLGFHPQVRWPTRCKRCFREYKEHAKKEDTIERSSYRTVDVSSRPRLTQSPTTIVTPDPPPTKTVEVEESRSRSSSISSTTSTSSIVATDENKDFSTPYSSISSEALNRLNRYRGEEKKAPVSDSLSIFQDPPVRRRKTTDLTTEGDGGDKSNSDSDSSRPSSRLSDMYRSSGPSTSSEETVTIRLRKTNSLGGDDGRGSSSSSPVQTPSPSPSPPPLVPRFRLSSKDSESSGVESGFSKYNAESSARSSGSSEDVTAGSATAKVKKPRKKRLLIQGVKEVPHESHDSDPDAAEGDSSADVAFIIQVKSTRKKKKDDDDDILSMTTTTDTTETTLVDVLENNSAEGGISSWEFEEIKQEVDRLREKCDRLEKEKAEILSRRVANLEAPKAQSREYLGLQQKVNQLTTTNEDLLDEQRHLETKVRELERDLASRPSVEITQRQVAELRSKLTSTEAQIDQLHEENREVVLKMRDLEEEMEEMKDSYREQQSEEFAATKKELDYEQKNNRLLQFKLRKVEKKCDHLEAEKKELELRVDSSNNASKIAKLEEELAKSKAENEKLLKESSKKDKGAKDSSNTLSPSIGLKKKSPVLTKAPSGEKVDPPLPPDFDPEQMLRDLQSTLERESDLREQLKFAEEEAQSLRQKISRIEEENESLLIQIKKMSAKSKTDLSMKGRVETGSFRDRDANQNQNEEKVDENDLKLQLEINEEQYKIVQRKVVELEDANQKLEKKLQQAEENAQLESSAPVTKSKNVDEVSLLRRKLIEKERELERSQTELMAVTKNKGKITRAKSLEIEESTKRLDTETKAELKKVSTELARFKEESEAKKKEYDDEVVKSKKELENQQARAVQLNESNRALIGQIEKFKKEMTGMKEQYESIQDDFVIKNSQLASQKEETEVSYNKIKKEFDTIDKELKALRETFNDRQDTWIKEKLSMQEKMKEMEKSTKQLLSIPGDKDTQKLKNLLKERSLDSDVRSRELETYKDQILQMQRDNDALRRQLEDFDKVAQVHLRTMSHEPTVKSDKEVKDLRERLASEEKAHKTETAQLKMRKDQEIALKNEDISSIQSQLSRAKRERDTFRQMVDSAQRAIAELKSRDNPSLRRDTSLTSIEEAATGARAAVITLQERVASLEDDLSESRRETSRAKTEFVTEKSSWEMKLGELQQKINELEEEKLLGGAGRVRGASALGRTRIELAWQKERDEQQRRLKEATTLARDLKNTLLEIERERDRERVEGRRRLEQMKGALEEEQEEMKRKVGESQCDLLELRDAHAKLRTANEKLRKDRERLESQREGQIKKELETRKVYLEREKILDQLQTKLNTNSRASNTNLANPGPPMSTTEILHYLQNIKALTEPEDLSNPKERRRGAFKRASSLGDAEGADIPKSRESLVSMPGSYGIKEHYGAAGRAPLGYMGSVSSSTLTLPSRGRVSGLQIGGRPNIGEFGAHSSVGFQAKGSLIRKAVSLEQTVAMPDEQKIWKGGSEAGSGTSLASDGQFSRGSSVDRMSTISSKSEKPTSLVGKMKKFVKSKSIEESPTAERLVKAGVQAAGVASNAGSDLSLNSDYEDRNPEPGMKLKDKVKGIFKRSTRSPSVEKKPQIAPAISQSQLFPPQRPSRESTPKREAVPASGQSTQRPLMPMSSQRPLMPSSGMLR